jgi:hypothetical protein
MLLFDKSNKQSTKLETAIMWSKSTLNMMNIYEESIIHFWTCSVSGLSFLDCSFRFLGRFVRMLCIHYLMKWYRLLHLLYMHAFDG